MSDIGRGGSDQACGRMADDLVLHLYGEASPAQRGTIEDHVASCAGCRKELESLRETLRAIDMADLGRMASAWGRRHLPPSWEEVRPALERESGNAARTARPAFPAWMKVAAAVLMAVGSFLAGTQYTALGPIASWGGWSFGGSGNVAAPEGTAALVPGDADSRLRTFAQRTDGYLNRSRLVLLEVANAETGSDSETVREIIRNLIRESREAREVADQIADPKIEEVVARLEAILREISRLSDWGDPSSIARLRETVNTSGMLEQLELLVPAPGEPGHGRADT